MKNGPKLSLARSTVPSSGLKRYEKPPDDELKGVVVSSVSSSRPIVSRVTSADSASLTKSPVGTPCVVSRNDSVSTSDSCAWVGRGPEHQHADQDEGSMTSFAAHQSSSPSRTRSASTEPSACATPQTVKSRPFLNLSQRVSKSVALVVRTALPDPG